MDLLIFLKFAILTVSKFLPKLWKTLIIFGENCKQWLNVATLCLPFLNKSLNINWIRRCFFGFVCFNERRMAWSEQQGEMKRHISYYKYIYTYYALHWFPPSRMRIKIVCMCSTSHQYRNRKIYFAHSVEQWREVKRRIKWKSKSKSTV